MIIAFLLGFVATFTITEIDLVSIDFIVVFPLVWLSGRRVVGTPSRR